MRLSLLIIVLLRATMATSTICPASWMRSTHAVRSSQAIEEHVDAYILITVLLPLLLLKWQEGVVETEAERLQLRVEAVGVYKHGEQIVLLFLLGQFKDDRGGGRRRARPRPLVARRLLRPTARRRRPLHTLLLLEERLRAV